MHSEQFRNRVVREYLRVSQDRSGDRRSPDQQHHEIVEAVQQRGWTLHPDPYRDDNRSASRYARRIREGFKQLLEDLEEGTFQADTLALWESSRGSRRVGEWVTLIELCQERDVSIWVISDGKLYDTTNPRDRRSLLEDAVDSEYESEKTRKRVMRSTHDAAKNGRPHGPNIYGYQRIYDPTNRRLLRIEEHPEQAPIVKDAARRVLSGDSLYSVAAAFNEAQVPPRRKTQKLHRAQLGWTAEAVKQMLSMPAYAGQRQHRGEVLDGVKTVWEPLIDPEDWEELQARLFSDDRKRKSPWGATHLLSGIAVCGICSGPVMAGRQYAGRAAKDEEGKSRRRSTYPTYVCQTAKSAGQSGAHVTMRVSHLDQIVTETVLARLERGDILSRLGQRNKSKDKQKEDLQKELEGYRQWLEDVRQRAESERNLDVLFDQEARVRPKMEAAQKQLETLAAVDPAVLDFIRDGAVRERWGQLVLQDQRRIVRALAVPRINPVPKEDQGRKGPNSDRVNVVWN